MKNNYRIWICAGMLFLSLIGQSIVTLAASQKTIILATTAWEPYVRADAKYRGYVYEIVVAAFNAVDYKVNVKYMPWKQATNEANQGKIDGIFPEYFTAKNPHLVLSESFSGGPLVFYKRRDSNITLPNDPTKDEVKTFQLMSKYRFGAVKGYLNVPAFDTNRQLKKSYVNSDKENLEQLFDKKVDLILIDKATAEHLLRYALPKAYQAALQSLQPPIAHKQLFVAVSKKNVNHAQIIAEFNRGLEIIKKNGVLNKILERDAHFFGHEVI